MLGWREYVWQLYWRFGRDYTRRNHLRARSPLPDWWTDLDADAVTARCLSSALADVRDRGWTHHIPRLMILGNHALQREYRPGALSEWFTTSFVDGFAPALGVTAGLSFVGALVGLGLPGARLVAIPEPAR